MKFFTACVLTTCASAVKVQRTNLASKFMKVVSAAARVGFRNNMVGPLHIGVDAPSESQKKNRVGPAPSHSTPNPSNSNMSHDDDLPPATATGVPTVEAQPTSTLNEQHRITDAMIRAQKSRQSKIDDTMKEWRAFHELLNNPKQFNGGNSWEMMDEEDKLYIAKARHCL